MKVQFWKYLLANIRKRTHTSTIDGANKSIPDDDDNSTQIILVQPRTLCMYCHKSIYTHSMLCRCTKYELRMRVARTTYRETHKHIILRNARVAHPSACAQLYFSRRTYKVRVCMCMCVTRSAFASCGTSDSCGYGVKTNKRSNWWGSCHEPAGLYLCNSFFISRHRLI